MPLAKRKNVPFDHCFYSSQNMSGACCEKLPNFIQGHHIPNIHPLQFGYSSNTCVVLFCMLSFAQKHWPPECLGEPAFFFKIFKQTTSATWRCECTGFFLISLLRLLLSKVVMLRSLLTAFVALGDGMMGDYNMIDIYLYISIYVVWFVKTESHATAY